MSLKEYQRKRTFTKTPEPQPAEPTHTPGNFFCVQRHDATRLHYDFRLQIDGVLKSWAVPKGPSLEPLSKNLAVHVEDHPLGYGNFEGNIPKGEYGGGSVMLWDRGSFELLGDAPALEQIKRGDLKFRVHGQKLHGEFALVLMKGRGKGNEWLIIKKRDAAAKPGWNIEDHAYSVLTGRTQQEIADDLPSRRPPHESGPISARAFPPGAIEAPMPQWVEPMQAESASKPPKGGDWLYEVKWDGIRALCFLQDQRVSMFSRRGNRCDQQYPELAVLPHYVAASSAILDGEIAVLDAQGRPSFAAIQPRIHISDPNSIAHLARRTPATLFLFDLLYLDGHDLRDVPLIERKRLLEEIVTPSEHIRVSAHFAGAGPEMLEAARLNGLEGIMAKQASSKYESRRSWSWLKIKLVKQQEFVIVGFLHEGNRSFFSSLILAVYYQGKLVHCGQVGTGFNDKTLAEIHARLLPLITETAPFKDRLKGVKRKVTWVKPELVAEVKYQMVTKDGILRAPVFLGLRDDRDPQDCVLEVSSNQIPDPPPEPAADPDPPRPAPPTEQKFNNLDKIFYPKDGITKGDVIHYYDGVAEFILPHLRDRPLSLKRYPNGIHADYFFQKNVGDRKFPAWIRTEPIDAIEYAICNDKPTLLYLANLGCIDQNPWMSRIGSLDNPDFVLIDLDPYECSYDQIVEAAQLTKQALDDIGMQGYPKTTGGDGMHIYIPVEPVYTYDQARAFAEILWHLVVGREPKLFTTPRAVEKRTKGRVYFDYLQIGRSKTIAAPYVLRAHDGAPVATPLDWKEVKKGLTPGQFHIQNAMARFHKTGDLFSGVLTGLQRMEGPLERLSDLIQGR